MRWCGLLIAGLLLAAAPVRADDQAEGLKLVDAAIKAAGGADKLKKLDTVSFKGKGKATHDGKEADVACDVSAKGQDRVRLQLEINENGKTESPLVVINGDQAWIKDEAKVPEEIFTALKAEFRALRLTQMLTPLKDKAVKLSPLGESKINGRAAQGVKVVQENKHDLEIFFDKETHLPVKCELRIKFEMDKEVTTTWLFSDAKAVEGVKHPMMVKLEVEIDNKKVVLELALSDIKPGAKLEDNTFDKP
jgi:outer membrane lipoprotein-sorting protein